MSLTALSLQRVVSRAVAAALVVVLVLTSLVVFALVRLGSQQSRLLDVVQPTVRAGGAYFQALLDADNGIHGYWLTEDRQFLEPYRQAAPVLATTGAELQRLGARERGVLPLVAALERAATAWRSGYAEPALAQLSVGTAERTASLLAGKALFDEIRVRYDALNTRLAAVRDEVRSNFRQATILLVVAVALLVAGIVALAGLALRGLHRQVLTPLVALGESAQAVSRGRLDQRIEGGGPRELQRLGDHLERMRETLVEQVHELAAGEDELRAQADELSERGLSLERSNRDLEQFAYVASHDLQEPLRKVASFCQLLQQRYGGQLDDRADTYINFAVDGARRMQVLINDLLAFSRVGRVRHQREVDLRVLAERVVGDLEVRLTEAGATVELGDLPTVWGDQVMLGQLLQNLVGNAVKFRNPDRAPVIRVTSLLDDDGDLDLVVADNGIGIEEQFTDKVFVIFQRLHPREAYEGTGIGLALCKRIVEAEGGRIWFDSVVGEGTAFHAVLSAASMEPPEPQPEAAAAIAAAPASTTTSTAARP